MGTGITDHLQGISDMQNRARAIMACDDMADT
jgi:hypothetical protein